MSAALQVTGLEVERDAGLLLRIDDLVVDDGAVVVVTGPADSGKTLFAAVLSGRAEASAGTMTVGGRRLTGTPAARRRLGLAATVADGNRIGGCTVVEALRLAGAGRAAAALERFPLLAARRDLRAELLSGGEHHVLQVACAWCAAPRVLVLDSPTTGLAADAAGAVRTLAIDAAAGGAAVLWLDQTQAAAPVAARWQLRGGVLSPVTAAG